MEHITALLAEGRTAQSVAAELNVLEGTLRVDVCRPDNVRAYESPKEASPHVLAEQALGIRRSNPRERPGRRRQVDTRWLASKRDLATCAEQPGPLVNIDLGQILLRPRWEMNSKTAAGRAVNTAGGFGQGVWDLAFDPSQVHDIVAKQAAAVAR
jgi:hypothetical protein